MTRLIVVVGVTGVQGSAVAHTFLGLSEWRVRGISRNKSSEASQTLIAKGVEIIEADLDNKESLIPAFEGAHVIFSNTDFFGHLFAAMVSNNASSSRTPNEIAYDLEVQQGVNIAEVAASPAVMKTLERFVLSSLCDARKASGGKYTTIYHFDTKSEMSRVIQSRFPKLAALMSSVLMGHYVTNWKAFPAMAPIKQPDGGFVISRPVPADQMYPFVVAHRDTGAFVKALVDAPPGLNLMGASQFMTWPEWTKTWGDVLGVKAEFKTVPAEEFVEGVPKPLAQELSDTYLYLEEFGFDGGDSSVVAPEQLTFTVPLTTNKEYIESENWSSVLES